MQCKPFTEKWVSYKKNQSVCEIPFQSVTTEQCAGQRQHAKYHFTLAAMRGVKRGTEGLDLDCSIFSTHPISQMLFKVLTRNEVKTEWTIPCYYKQVPLNASACYHFMQHSGL